MVAAKPRTTSETQTPMPALAPVESPAEAGVGDAELRVGFGVLIEDDVDCEAILEGVSATLSDA